MGRTFHLKKQYKGPVVGKSYRQRIERKNSAARTKGQRGERQDSMVKCFVSHRERLGFCSLCNGWC